jgi:hypothetical protein
MGDPLPPRCRKPRTNRFIDDHRSRDGLKSPPWEGTPGDDSAVESVEELGAHPGCRNPIVERRPDAGRDVTLFRFNGYQYVAGDVCWYYCPLVVLISLAVLHHGPLHQANPQ